MDNNWGSVTKNGRLESLDVIRGFALCGIIFANLMSFTGFYSLSFSQIQLLPIADRLVLFLIDCFIEGKFYTLFAMLFGAGFAILQQRKKSEGKPFTSYWSKRMLVLLLIGIAHMGLVWHGDILILYSLLGLCLIAFSRLNNKQLFGSIVILLTAPLLIHLVAYLTVGQSFWGALRAVAVNFKYEQGYEAVNLLQMRTSSEPVQVFIANLYSAIPRPMSYLITGRPFQVLGQFLVGLLLIRLYVASNKSLLLPSKKVTLLLLLFGTLLNLQYALIKAYTGSPFSLNELGLYQGFVYHVGAIVMALGYLALLYLLCQSVAVKWLAKLAVLGRMSLTIYLTQTTGCVLLFYGYGLGLMGEVPFVSILLFGTGILVTQYVLAQWWFKYKNQGPMELLWRKCI